MLARRLAKLSICASRWATLSPAETSGGAGGSGLLIDDNEDRRGVAVTPDPEPADLLTVLSDVAESGLKTKASRVASGATWTDRRCSFLDTGPPREEMARLGDSMLMAGEFSMEVTPSAVVAYVVMLNREPGCVQASPCAL